jgi:hypothetical protein
MKDLGEEGGGRGPTTVT